MISPPLGLSLIPYSEGERRGPWWLGDVSQGATCLVHNSCSRWLRLHHVSLPWQFWVYIHNFFQNQYDGHRAAKSPSNTKECELNSRLPRMTYTVYYFQKNIADQRNSAAKKETLKILKMQNLTWWSILTLEETSRNLTNLRPAKANDSIVWKLVIDFLLGN